MNEEKLEVTKLEDRLLTINQSNASDNLEEIRAIEFVLEVVKDLTASQLKNINNDKNLQVKICEQIENFKKESKMSYLEVTISLAHYINFYFNIDYSIKDISPKFGFLFYFRNFNNQVENGGFAQYYYNDYYEREGNILKNLFKTVSHLDNYNEIYDLYSIACQEYEKCYNERGEYADSEEGWDIIDILENQLSRLDTRYFKINNNFIKELKKYVKNQVKNRTLFQL